MKIDFLVADNPYNSTHNFATWLSEAFERQGAEVRRLDISDETFVDVARQIVERQPTFTISFSDITDGEGTSIGNALKIPHFTYIIDPAIYFLPHFQGEYSYVSCVDEGDVAFVKMLGFERVMFLPHAVKQAAHYSETPEYDAVFFGTCIDYKQLELPPNLREAAEKVLMTESSILEALVEAKVPDEMLVAAFHLVDHYTRGRERVELLHGISEVAIWGEGPWEKYAPHASVNAPIPFHETIDIMRLAKVVLNASCRFKQGYHERIFTALAAGTPVITLENRLLGPFEGVLTYPAGGWDGVEALLGATPNVAAGQAKVLSEHTWDQRATTILQLFQS